MINNEHGDAMRVLWAWDDAVEWLHSETSPGLTRAGWCKCQADLSDDFMDRFRNGVKSRLAHFPHDPHYGYTVMMQEPKLFYGGL